jgi:hypothetical protein
VVGNPTTPMIGHSQKKKGLTVQPAMVLAVVFTDEIVGCKFDVEISFLI